MYKAGDTYADPWVLEGLLSGDPLGWVDGQHLVNQVFGLWGDCVPLWGRKLKGQAEPHVLTFSVGLKCISFYFENKFIVSVIFD